MRTYLEFLKIPGVNRLVISALPGRLAYSMIALATFFFVQDITGSITLHRNWCRHDHLLLDRRLSWKLD